uniref:Kinesin motor domain-containing protein n=1 Tax=Angiostrongylus cantonensis TaxID=6313 RepID=A0A0K0D9L7_ANGCA
MKSNYDMMNRILDEIGTIATMKVPAELPTANSSEAAVFGRDAVAAATKCDVTGMAAAVAAAQLPTRRRSEWRLKFEDFAIRRTTRTRVVKSAQTFVYVCSLTEPTTETNFGKNILAEENKDDLKYAANGMGFHGIIGGENGSAKAIKLLKKKIR